MKHTVRWAESCTQSVLHSLLCTCDLMLWSVVVTRLILVQHDQDYHLMLWSVVVTRLILVQHDQDYHLNINHLFRGSYATFPPNLVKVG